MRLKYIFIIVLLLVVASLYCYVSTFERYVLIEDELFRKSYARISVFELKKDFLKKKIILQSKVIKTENLADSTKISESISSASNYSKVILTPVISYACNYYDIDVCALIEDCEVWAISPDNRKNYFSYTLTSDNSQAIETANSKYFGDLDVEICPEPDKITSSFAVSNNKKYFILDYRFAKAVPKNRLLGVIIPSFDTDAFEKGENGVLNYEFRQIIRKIL